MPQGRPRRGANNAKGSGVSRIGIQRNQTHARVEVDTGLHGSNRNSSSEKDKGRLEDEFAGGNLIESES